MIIVMNPGSSSLKWALYDTRTLGTNGSEPLRRGVIKGIGLPNGPRTHLDALQIARESLRDFEPLCKAVVYRIVHGGGVFSGPVALNGAVLGQLEGLVHLAPLHLPIELELITAGKKVFTDKAPIGVFDTAFFHALPLEAQIYPLPWEWTKQYGIRRFGFHGFSHRGAARHALARFEERHPRTKRAPKLITVHIGQGVSVTALVGMKPVDTSMGFTPNDGVPMTTRSGALDPGLVRFLLRRIGSGVFEKLEQESGIAAVAGVKADWRDILWAAGKPVTDPEWVPPHHRLPPMLQQRAMLALELFENAMTKTIAGYAGLLGGVDVVCFTGAVGAESAWMRDSITDRLKSIGPFYPTSIGNQEEYEMALEGWGFLKAHNGFK